MMNIHLAVTLISTLMPQAQSLVIHDQSWWNSVSKARRIGFIIGYIDCSTSVTSRQIYTGLIWNQLEIKISKYYSDATSKSKLDVADAMMSICSKGHKIRNNTTAILNDGIFTGEYWWECSSDERKGIIEGYMECLKKEKYSELIMNYPVEYYEKEISNWYGLKDDDETIINKNIQNTIAQVIKHICNTGKMVK